MNKSLLHFVFQLSHGGPTDSCTNSCTNGGCGYLPTRCREVTHDGQEVIAAGAAWVESLAVALRVVQFAVLPDVEAAAGASRQHLATLTALQAPPMVPAKRKDVQFLQARAQTRATAAWGHCIAGHQTVSRRTACKPGCASCTCVYAEAGTTGKAERGVVNVSLCRLWRLKDGCATAGSSAGKPSGMY